MSPKQLIKQKESLVFILFCFSANVQDSFTGSSSICRLCKVKSCVSCRQNSLPNQMSLSHPVQVKLICDKHALHEAPMRNVLLSDSDVSKTFHDDDESFHEKYLADWDSTVHREFRIHSDFLSPDCLESHNNRVFSVEHLENKKPETLLKKTRFKIDDWRSDSEQTYDDYDVSNNKETENDIHSGEKVHEELHEKKVCENKSNGESDVNLNSSQPNNLPNSPSNCKSPDQLNLFLKCKSLVDVEVEPSITPSSALPPSDYGDRSHASVQPHPQGSKREPFSRSLSNADVQPDEQRGKFNIKLST